MSRKVGPPGGKGRGLSADDHELWQHTARTLEPLKRGKARVHPADESESSTAQRTAEPSSPADASAKPSRREPHAPAHPPAKMAAPRPAKKAAPDLNAFDPRAARKLRRGHVDIEGRIDLHGMRQSEAHTALLRFIMASAAKGKRWVLVITGKGAASSRAYDDDRHWSMDGPQRGVLKRNVPMWLAEPDVRGLIVSFTEAAPEHGGSGALYVHLRRQRTGHD